MAAIWGGSGGGADQAWQAGEGRHRAHGVPIHLGVTVDCIVEERGRGVGVRLSDGQLLAADLIVVGIGIVPAVEPLLDVGARGGNGVAVDEHCRTSLPGVFAIGDCARHSSHFADGVEVRLESVQKANDMATVVAKAITGAPEPYRAIPWFWSNQYDLKLQTIGLSLGHDQEILRGDPASRSFSVIYLKDCRVTALDCVSSVKDYV